MKKSLLVVGALAIAIAAAPLFAAFEAHVINVTAHIENALKVMPPDDMTFGTVFPQEYHEKNLSVTTSESFCNANQRRVLNIDYKIVQKPKCINATGEHAPVNYATHECPKGYEPMLSLCPFLSKTPKHADEPPYEDYGVPAFHDPSDPASVATGTINKDNDILDEWIIDLAVPCFEGMCAQDWPEFVASINPDANPADYILPASQESSDFGCDLWIEVTDIY